jgi:ADP-ribose pyrophosphatase
MPDEGTFDRDRDVALESRETAYQGYFRVDRYRLRHRRFDGTWSRTLTREVFERGHAAGVLPYDPERDVVVLIEQFRMGPYAHGGSPWQVEVIAGIIHAGETAEQVARREALEEAGCTLGVCERIAGFYMSPGAVSEHLTLYCARADTTGVGGVHGLPEEDEDIRVRVLPLDQALAWADAGRIQNSPALIGLLWLARARRRLRTAWR